MPVIVPTVLEAVVENLGQCAVGMKNDILVLYIYPMTSRSYVLTLEFSKNMIFLFNESISRT